MPPCHTGHPCFWKGDLLTTILRCAVRAVGDHPNLLTWGGTGPKHR